MKCNLLYSVKLFWVFVPIGFALALTSLAPVSPELLVNSITPDHNTQQDNPTFKVLSGNGTSLGLSPGADNVSVGAAKNSAVLCLSLFSQIVFSAMSYSVAVTIRSS